MFNFGKKKNNTNIDEFISKVEKNIKKTEELNMSMSDYTNKLIKQTNLYISMR